MGFLATYICYLILLLYLTYYAMFILINGFWSVIITTILIATSIGYPLIYLKSLKTGENIKEET